MGGSWGVLGYSSGVDITWNLTKLGDWIESSPKKLQAKGKHFFFVKCFLFVFEFEDSDSVFFASGLWIIMTYNRHIYIYIHDIYDINDMTINGMHSSVSVM